VGGGGEGEGSRHGREPCHEIPKCGSVQGPATTIPSPALPTFGTCACLPPTAIVYTFGAAATSAPSHARAAIFGFRAFVAEPGRPPPSTLHPHPTPTSAPTKARGP
jgi:hypothetical protein